MQTKILHKLFADTFETSLESRLGCYGEFTLSDDFCLRHCAIALDCAVAKNHILQHDLPEGGFTVSFAPAYHD
ncbi:MAG: hypothetical protein LBF41_07250 [Deltaproteobacteria bacterium]|nr:hypothetical protein [Deltaproteobacteria bacterium]